MKELLLRLLVAFFIIVLILVAFSVTRPGFFFRHRPLSPAPTRFDPHLSVVMIQQQRKTAETIVAPSPSASVQSPAPLDHLSKEEQRRFPGAVVVEATEIEGPEAGQIVRLRILKTDFKYHFIRTEEIIHQGSLLSRAEMVADHFLVTLSPEIAAEDFYKKLGPQATMITCLASDPSLYRVDLVSSSLSALPRALEKGSQVSGALCEPDLLTSSIAK
jgi:hypothetical protein